MTKNEVDNLKKQNQDLKAQVVISDQEIAKHKAWAFAFGFLWTITVLVLGVYPSV